MPEFSERLKELRGETKLTQEQIAIELGLTKRAYQTYERKEAYPEFPGLIRLADYIDVSLDYLVGRSDIRERR